MNRFSRRHLALAAGALLLAGAAAPFAVNAQQSGTTTPQTPVTGQKRADGGRQQGYVAQLAATLGVSEQKLRDAMAQTRTQVAARRFAAVLGLPASQVEAGLTQGKTLTQIGADNGKSRDALRAAIQAAREQHLQKAVQKGRLTADQANQRRQGFAQRLDKLLDRNFQQLGTRKRA